MKHGILVTKKVNTISLKTIRCLICPPAHCSEIWNGDPSGLLVNAPHIEFLEHYKQIGELVFENLPSRYCRMYEYWDEVGYGLGGRTPEYIMRKARNLAKLFHSVSKGFRSDRKIQVLGESLWNSRGFSGGEDLVGPEIYHGHHRAACLLFLGKKKCEAIACKDTRKGTKEWVQKLNRMSNL